MTKLNENATTVTLCVDPAKKSKPAKMKRSIDEVYGEWEEHGDALLVAFDNGLDDDDVRMFYRTAFENGYFVADVSR